MTDSQNAYWETIYQKGDLLSIAYDGWLDPYVQTLREGGPLLDLGCGSGVNTIHLHRLGIHTIACDFSQAALDHLLGVLPAQRTLCLDMTNGLPFADGSMGTVIADLCLHYFSTDVTYRVLADIRRVLKPGGMLLCRVNAYEDGFVSLVHEKIEEDYYWVKSCAKRFFTRQSLLHFLAGWQVTKLTEKVTEKYGFIKPLLFAQAEK